jgi:hypothetical protein
VALISVTTVGDGPTWLTLKCPSDFKIQDGYSVSRLENLESHRHPLFVHKEQGNNDKT